ncbi:MAG: acetyltransferase [Pseudomonadota bacterium]
MSAARSLILLGAGGHAQVVLALMAASGRPVAAVCAPELASTQRWRGLAVLGADDALAAMDAQAFEVLNGVGHVAGSTLRARLYQRFRLLNFRFPAVVHPSAWVAPDVCLDEGAQVMAGVIIQPGARIGANTIINTRASVDHDCQIGRDVHIAPGAILCGSVRVGDGAFIGAGATVIEGLSIGAGALVGAGSVVLCDLAPGARLLGTRLSLPKPG